MIEFFLRVLWETWSILKEASIFLLFGFVLAGILATLVPARLLSRLLGTGKTKSVLWGASIGAPLPLCSCGVLPTALTLRREGATPGATVAFLIATPETGVDSISLSYALMDPIITVFRPLAAVVTAISAGLATNFLTRRPSPPAPLTTGEAAPEHASGRELEEVVHGHSHSHHHEHQPPLVFRRGERIAAVRTAAGRVYRYAFHQLLDDTSYWLMLGIVLSGVVAAAVPAAFFEQNLSGGFGSMLLMLLIGIPIYTCASSSTPLAAALVLKGLNPGAALVFLLAGPATNLGSLVVLLKFLGARIMAIYLASIVVLTLLAGYTLNWIYRTWGIDPRATFGAGTAFIPESVKILGALVLLVLLGFSMRRTHVPSEWIWLRERFAGLTGLRISAARLAAVSAAAIGLLYLESGLFSVQPGEVGIRLRFGRIVAPTLEPGLHYRLPWPVESHRVVSKERVQRVEFGFSTRPQQAALTLPAGRERTAAGWTPLPGSVNVASAWFQKEAEPGELFLLTSDGNLIDLRWAVQYRVKDPVAFTFNVAEPEIFMRSVSLASLRSVVARSAIDELYTFKRSTVEQAVAQSIQASADLAHAGIDVLSFNLLYVHPPSEVHDAFRDVASAQEDKMRTVNRANIFAVETINQAKADAAAMIEQAQGYKEQQMLHAQGDAASFLLKLAAYRRAPGLTEFRLQVEAIEATLPGLPKFVTPDAGELKDFDMWLLQPPGSNRSR